MPLLHFYSNLFATVTYYYPSDDLDKQMMGIMEEEVQPIKQFVGVEANVIAQSLPEAVIHAGKERGGNALSVEAEGPLTSESYSHMTSFWISYFKFLLKPKHCQ